MTCKTRKRYDACRTRLKNESIRRLPCIKVYAMDYVFLLIENHYMEIFDIYIYIYIINVLNVDLILYSILSYIEKDRV